MASISKKGAKNHHTYILTLTETATSTANNTSTVGYSFDLIDDADWFWEGWNNSITYSVSANGAVIASGSIPNHLTKNQNIAKGTFTVPHNTDGTKSISYSFSVTDNANQYYTSGNASASGTMALTAIPRYLTITSFEITNKTENSVVVKWSTDVPRSSTYYSLDNGTTWIGSATDGETLASDNKSGSFNIPNLAANSTYNLKVKFRRADNSLWTESGAQSFSTYNYPHCTNSPDYIIGDALTLDFYNPLSRNITVKGYSVSTGYVVFSGTTNGTRLVGFNDQDTINRLYASIPNSQSGAYRVVVSYGNVAMTRNNGNSYRVRGNEVPTINGFDYIDNKAAVVNITGNNQHIVQNQSELLVRFTAATPNYSAGSISQYYIECNGKKANGSKEGAYNIGTIDSARDVDLTLTVVDSRGLSTSKTIKVTMLPHSTPTAVVTLKRLNNYEDETYLTVDGSISSVNGKNAMTIQYRYKPSGGNYGSFSVIGDRETHTLTLDKNNIFVFEVFVTDAFGSQFVKEYPLGKGVFPLFIDVEKNSVGINCFPAESQSLELNGFNLFNVYKCCKNILLGSNTGLTIQVNGFANSDKIPIVVVGTDNSSMTPVFTVIHMRSGSGFGHISLGLDSTITRDGNRLHIAASQWSYFTVFSPLGADITLSNSAL